MPPKTRSKTPEQPPMQSAEVKMPDEPPKQKELEEGKIVH